MYYTNTDTLCSVFFPAVIIMYFLLVRKHSERDTVKADNLKSGICYIYIWMIRIPLKLEVTYLPGRQ